MDLNKILCTHWDVVRELHLFVNKPIDFSVCLSSQKKLSTNGFFSTQMYDLSFNGSWLGSHESSSEAFCNGLRRSLSSIIRRKDRRFFKLWIRIAQETIADTEISLFEDGLWKFCHIVQYLYQYISNHLQKGGSDIKTKIGLASFIAFIMCVANSNFKHLTWTLV